MFHYISFFVLCYDYFTSFDLRSISFQSNNLVKRQRLSCVDLHSIKDFFRLLNFLFQYIVRRVVDLFVQNVFEFKRIKVIDDIG